MTASATDADDLVQETFLRALEGAPPDTTRPWLTRVAVSLSIDALRKRKSTPYVGPWLPEPAMTPEPPSDAPPPGERIGLLESGTFAFLLAAEALSEEQRAVLLLRDVFELEGAETTEALELTTDDVKQTLHRARQALQPYYTARVIPTTALAERNQRALAALFAAIAKKDVAAVLDTITDDAIALTDGGGRVQAAIEPIHGDDVAKLALGLAGKTGVPLAVTPLFVNGLPALLYDVPSGGRTATRTFVRCDSDGDGRVRRLHVVVNPLKLHRLRV